MQQPVIKRDRLHEHIIYEHIRRCADWLFEVKAGVLVFDADATLTYNELKRSSWTARGYDKLLLACTSKSRHNLGCCKGN